MRFGNIEDKETSEVKECTNINDNAEVELSKEALEKYDMLFEDDEIEKNDEAENADVNIDGAYVKFDELFPDDVDNRELSLEEKEKIEAETKWSEEVISNIGSWEEYEVYKNAGVVECDIDNKKCLIKSDINWKQSDAFGRTNKERVEQGLSVLDKDGKVIELHHIGQHADSPLAELTQEEHRGKGNDTILHNKTKDSEIDRQAFAVERSSHWQSRLNESEVSA